jgi:hypothetical protein
VSTKVHSAWDAGRPLNMSIRNPRLTTSNVIVTGQTASGLCHTTQLTLTISPNGAVLIPKSTNTRRAPKI